jgi:hypothetical protein
LKDVEYLTDQSRTVSSAVGAEAPLLGLAGVPVPSPLDPGAKIEYAKEWAKQDSASIQSEMIYAIQYREVRVKMGHRSALTQKIFWEQIFGERGASDDEMGDVDDTVIEAQLLDDVEDTPGLSSVGKVEEGFDICVVEQAEK